jgi:hypothetical protein
VFLAGQGGQHEHDPIVIYPPDSHEESSHLIVLFSLLVVTVCVMWRIRFLEDVTLDSMLLDAWLRSSAAHRRPSTKFSWCIFEVDGIPHGRIAC